MTDISIHIHEDHWGMRNLYPIAALSEAAVDVEEAASESERNRAPDGMGWTDVHIVRPPSIDYSVAGLRLADAISAIEPFMPRVRKFTAAVGAGFDPNVRDPLGSYDQDAYCYGFDASCFIKLDLDDDRVQDVWFECRTAEMQRLAALRGAIVAIDALVPSAIADYWEDTAGAVRNIAFLDRYFQRLAAAGHSL